MVGKMKILIYGVRDYEEEVMKECLKAANLNADMIHEDLTEETVKKAEGYDGISIQQVKEVKDEKTFEQLKEYGVKVISSRTAGVDMINLEAAAKNGIIVTNVPRYSPNAIAELAVSHSLNLLRKCDKVDGRMKKNDFRWKDINFGFLVSARLGGIVVSPTQAILDGFGVTKATAVARDNGGVMIGNTKIDPYKYYSVTGQTEGLLSDYIYKATNVRLQEVSVGYTLPSKWFNDVMKVNVSFVGRNLWMIYNKAPFDPEATASTGTYFQGIDYFMQPSLRNLGFSVKVEF